MPSCVRATTSRCPKIAAPRSAICLTRRGRSIISPSIVDPFASISVLVEAPRLARDLVAQVPDEVARGAHPEVQRDEKAAHRHGNLSTHEPGAVCGDFVAAP